MVLRTLALVGGLFCAAGLSQFPEYSQQYTQRLAGAVNELEAVVVRFDADAAAVDLTREEALKDLIRSGGIAEARAQSMRVVFRRHDKLVSDLNVLRSTPPVRQLAEMWRMTDTDVSRRALQDFKPALPASFDGVGFGMIGFVFGWLLLSALRLTLRVFFWRQAQTV